jgi:hypothetical protein
VVEDCTKGITNVNGILSGLTVQLVIRTDQEPPTLYNIISGVIAVMCNLISVFNVYNLLHQIRVEGDYYCRNFKKGEKSDGVIIKAYHCYELHTKFYPISFSQG